MAIIICSARTSGSPSDTSARAFASASDSPSANPACWGRHYIVTFGLLPVLAYPVLWCLLLAFELLLAFMLGYGWDWKKLHAAANNPVAFQHLLLAVHFMDYLAIALVTLLFCWLARRAMVKLKWMVISCVICSLLAVIFGVKLEPHTFSANGSMGINMHSFLAMPWFRATIPLLVAGATYVVQRWIARRSRQKFALS